MPVANAALIKALSTLVGPTLAAELVKDFLKLRHDDGTGTLERASPGKFVETAVQCLQQLGTGTFDAHPDVDRFLNQQVEQITALPEGLRICAARVARSIYTLRNKRNVAHKAVIDPSKIDLSYAHHAAAWIMAEFVRSASGVTMDEAGRLIEKLQAPVGKLVEELGDVRLVHGVKSIRSELLILLHSHYPNHCSMADIMASLSRRDEATIRARLSELFRDKMIHGSASNGYRLTAVGFDAAVAEIEKVLANQKSR